MPAPFADATRSIPVNGGAMTANEAHTDKEGFFAVDSSGNAALVTTSNDADVFVITSGAPSGGKSGVHVGLVQVWMTEAVTTAFSKIRTHSDGSGQLANATSDVVVGRALTKCAANSYAWCWIRDDQTETIP
jgi:hypothetical protein